MSYILDALKKSEQARQQGAGAPKYSLLPVVDGETSQRQIWPYVLAAGLLINAAVLYAWLRPGPSTDAPAAGATKVQPPLKAANVKAEAVVPTPPASRAGVMPAARRGAAALQAPPVRAEDRTASAAAFLGQKNAKPAGGKAPTEGVRVLPQVPDAGGRPAVETVTAKPAASAPAQKPTQAKDTAGAAESAAVAGLPVVSVTGIIHGEGSNGMAIVNDKLVREGDEIMPGLTLERIQGESVILNYKGQRFTR